MCHAVDKHHNGMIMRRKRKQQISTTYLADGSNVKNVCEIGILDVGFVSSKLQRSEAQGLTKATEGQFRVSGPQLSFISVRECES
jgi:hypothetical protein